MATDGTPGKDVPHAHLQAHLACDAVSLAALCDPDPERRRIALQMSPEARIHESLERMLDEEQLDLLAICSPTALREQTFTLALKHGVRLFHCEKPLAPDIPTATRILALCRDRGARVAINYQRRWSPLVAEVRSLIKDGEIGAVQHVACSYCAGIVNDATHLFDLVRYLVGEFAWVRGSLLDNRRGGNDPNIHGMFALDCGATGSLQAFDRNAYNLFELDILGTRGRLRSLNHLRGFECFSARQDAQYRNDRFLVGNSLLQESQPDPDCILAGLEDLSLSETPPRCGLKDGFSALAVADAFLKSARHSGAQCTPTSVPPPDPACVPPHGGSL